MRLNRQPGFTLVELVVVVTLLAILAVVALPRFINTSSEAYAANLESLRGTILIGGAAVQAKARLKGIDKLRFQVVDVDGDGEGDLRLHSGYPQVGNACDGFVRELPYWLQIDLPSSCTDDEAVGSKWRAILDWNSFHFMPVDFLSVDEDCFVTYREATSSGDDGFSRGTPLEEMRVTLEDSGC